MLNNKLTASDRYSNSLYLGISGLMLIVFAILCIYPFYYTLIYSLSDSASTGKGIYFLPQGFTLSNYTQILSNDRILQALFISGMRTVIGTFVALLFCATFAFVILQKELKFRKFYYRLCVTTMYFHAGLIPWYITMMKYGLKNSFWLYILPAAMAPFFIILIKTYMENVPVAIVESAVIDGANLFLILYRIMLPLSIPVLAAVAVFSAVNQWNAWTDNFYLVREPKLQTLQLLLLDFLRQSEAIANALNSGGGTDMSKRAAMLTPMSVRMTVTMISVLPILLVYPFLQRFFIKGLMLGAVKG